MCASKANKSYLPTRLCKTCGRPFSWRKKWAHNWEQVQYCSDRSRMQKKQKSSA